MVARYCAIPLFELFQGGTHSLGVLPHGGGHLGFLNTLEVRFVREVKVRRAQRFWLRLLKS